MLLSLYVIPVSERILSWSLLLQHRCEKSRLSPHGYVRIGRRSPAQPLLGSHLRPGTGWCFRNSASMDSSAPSYSGTVPGAKLWQRRVQSGSSIGILHRNRQALCLHWIWVGRKGSSLERQVSFFRNCQHLEVFPKTVYKGGLLISLSFSSWHLTQSPVCAR